MKSDDEEEFINIKTLLSNFDTVNNMTDAYANIIFDSTDLIDIIDTTTKKPIYQLQGMINTSIARIIKIGCHETIPTIRLHEFNINDKYKCTIFSILLSDAELLTNTNEIELIKLLITNITNKKLVAVISVKFFTNINSDIFNYINTDIDGYYSTYLYYEEMNVVNELLLNKDTTFIGTANLIHKTVELIFSEKMEYIMQNYQEN